MTHQAAAKKVVITFRRDVRPSEKQIPKELKQKHWSLNLQDILFNFLKHYIIKLMTTFYFNLFWGLSE